MIKTMVMGLIFVLSSSAFASDILLARQLGQTSCYMTSSYVGLIYAGEEVDGREPRYTAEIPNNESLKAAIQTAKASGSSFMPKEIFERSKSAYGAYTDEQMVIVLTPANSVTKNLIDLINYNCSPE
ncbi:hypothetical protein [Bdellovibrio sp. NC01]|uniref:hypothetical protein n=1 Tax=Bdellovibrio sp. NC01 TaxID=2220073 RepID=UPI00115842F7|nr:hypothetical protein [Bdellovibrio sp. NC01]QDK37994.1 hypothetical protein DOE51_10540 [Bdellovibrio sp. NC01]